MGLNEESYWCTKKLRKMYRNKSKHIFISFADLEKSFNEVTKMDIK